MLRFYYIRMNILNDRLEVVRKILRKNNLKTKYAERIYFNLANRPIPWNRVTEKDIINTASIYQSMDCYDTRTRTSVFKRHG